MNPLGLWLSLCVVLSVFSVVTRAAVAGPPTIIAVSPEPGFVTQLSAITVTFSEAVTGVKAVDFLLNGFPATSFTGSGAKYTFTFTQPPYGPVDVSWEHSTRLSVWITNPSIVGRSDRAGRISFMILPGRA